MEWWFRFLDRWLHRVDRLLLWCGFVLLVVAGCFWLPKWLWNHSMKHAMGTVTEVETRQNAQGNIIYFPHFRFRLPGDQIVQVVGKIGNEDPAYSERQVVPVAYKAGDPQGAILAPRRKVYKRAIEFGVTGTILFDVGAVLWFQRWRRQVQRIS